jgi:TRAP-type mannitol/chloroaromatic compound transport system permease small subunit
MSDKTEITLKTEGLGNEILKGIHAAKSYVGPAWVTLLLYYIGFFFVGFICNLVFLSKSKESMRITGSSPSGRGCLLFLLWTHIIIPILILIIAIAGGAFVSTSGY